MTPDEATRRAVEMAEGGARAMLGLAGPPGAGKSTLVERITAAVGIDRCVVVPMDGFHLDNSILHAHGTRQRKGAPVTFDAGGYVQLLQRLRTQSADEVVYAPRYDRALSTSVAGAIEIRPEVALIVTEGNYLLLDSDPWCRIAPLLDQRWFVSLDDDVRIRRLIARHIEFGKTPSEAEEWVMRSDETNAAIVKASAHRADATIQL